MEGQEQNKSEDPTPFKLKKAREKGQVARGMDLGFMGSLIGLTFFMLLFGAEFFANITRTLRQTLVVGMDRATDPFQAIPLVGFSFWAMLEPLAIFGGIVITILIFLDILQLRGFIFTAAPLKPDFTRLNPAKGLKRLFSMRMLKETLKNIIKMTFYTGALIMVVLTAIEDFGPSLVDGKSLAQGMTAAGQRLLFTFLAVAALFVVIDQIIVRKEYRKQMRMSHRELQRETKDREGEPRQKQVRRKMHADMSRQAQGLGMVEGSDFLITNPDHFAVALRYDAERDSAPVVQAKGQGHYAQLLKRRAQLLAVPAFADPPLARALFRETDREEVIAPQHFERVATHYRNYYERQTRQKEDSAI